MGKRSLFSLSVLFLLCSSAYAAPMAEEGQSIYVWPRFWQDEALWGCDVYAGHGVADPCRVEGKYASNTIAAKGCRITSLAMLLRYHGLTWVPDEERFPKLNPACEGKWDTSYCNIA